MFAFYNTYEYGDFLDIFFENKFACRRAMQKINKNVIVVKDYSYIQTSSTRTDKIISTNICTSGKTVYVCIGIHIAGNPRPNN